jgi:hypothetical protein
MIAQIDAIIKDEITERAKICFFNTRKTSRNLKKKTCIRPGRFHDDATKLLMMQVL